MIEALWIKKFDEAVRGPFVLIDVTEGKMFESDAKKSIYKIEDSRRKQFDLTIDNSIPVVSAKEVKDKAESGFFYTVEFTNPRATPYVAKDGGQKISVKADAIKIVAVPDNDVPDLAFLEDVKG